MHPGKIAVAATAFVCTTLLTFTWSEQHGASLSVQSAQAVENAKSTEKAKSSEKAEATENAKATENTKARVTHRQTRASAEHVARRHDRRAAYGPGPAPSRAPNLVADGDRPAAAPNAATTAANSPRVYTGGGPYASAEGWEGGGFASSPWGDYECRPTSKFDCRPYPAKTWK